MPSQPEMPPSKPSQRPFSAAKQDWTKTFLQHRSGPNGTKWNPSKDGSDVSQSSSTDDFQNHPSQQPSEVCTCSEEDLTRQQSSPRPTSARNPKHKKGLSVAMFVNAVISSMILLVYTEYQLWMILETEQNHNNILRAIGNNATIQTRLRSATSPGLARIGDVSIQENLIHYRPQQEKDEESAPDEDADDDRVENDEILHIIHSRFMQHQPNLVHLGEARLHLFRHFFLQSLEIQSSANFFCIIRTDPHLDPSLKHHLIQTLEDSKVRHILVASNETPKSQYREFKSGNIKSSDIWSGSLDDVRNYLHLSNTTNISSDVSTLYPRIIETRLDADDSLHRDFVETLQDEANQNYQFRERTWRIWCVASHAEWQYQSMFDSANDGNHVGSLVALQVTYCVTPGLSVAYVGDEETMQVMPSTLKHEKLLHTKLCKDGDTSAINCRSFVPMLLGALRARTPTSAGMLNLVYNGTTFNKRYVKGASKQKDIQTRLWWAVQRFFGFTKSAATYINDHLKLNLKEIARENLEGQCTRGHSCKNSSQILLRSILEGTV